MDLTIDDINHTFLSILIYFDLKTVGMGRMTSNKRTIENKIQKQTKRNQINSMGKGLNLLESPVIFVSAEKDISFLGMTNPFAPFRIDTKTTNPLDRF